MLFEASSCSFRTWRRLLVQLCAPCGSGLHARPQGHVFMGRHSTDPWLGTARAIVGWHWSRHWLLSERRLCIRHRSTRAAPDRPAFAQARTHAVLVFGSGGLIGLLLGMAALYSIASDNLVRRFHESGHGVEMVAYVSIPSALSLKTTYSQSDKLRRAPCVAASAPVCVRRLTRGSAGTLDAPARTGFSSPASSYWRSGITLQAGATSAVKRSR